MDITSTESTAPGVFNPSIPRLNIPNQQIKADLTLSKTFVDAGGNAITPPAGATVMVDIYGPVVYTDNEPTGVGALLYNDLVISADNNWTLEIQDMAYGHYFVEEIMGSLHGYTQTGVTFPGKETLTLGGHTGTIIKVENTTNQTLSIQNQYTAWEAADFYVMKTDENLNDIAGAKFQLWDGNTNVTQQHLPEGAAYDTAAQAAVTDVNGNIHFVDFNLDSNESKTYILKEAAPASGYYLSENEYEVTVTLTNGVYDISVDSSGWDQTDDTLTVLNKPILGQIKVTKAFDPNGDPAPDGTLVTFRVTGSNVSRTATVAAKDDWTHTFEDLPLGTYTVSETCTIMGHTFTTTYKVNSGTAQNGTSTDITLSDNSEGKLTSGIPSEAKAEVLFTNTLTRQENLVVHPAFFEVLKVGENGEALEGATFSLFTDEDCNNALTDVSFRTSVTTDDAGIARFTGLKLPDMKYDEYGKQEARKEVYYLKETKAPTGYVLGTTVWKITLDEDLGENFIKVDKLNANGIFETVVDWVVGIFKKDGNNWVSNGTTPVLKVSNQRIKGTLTVNKEYNGVDQDDLGYSDIELHVHGPIVRTNGVVTDIGPMVSAIKLNNGAKSNTLSNLEIGEYVIRETFSSIHGYTWNSVTYQVDGQVASMIPYEQKNFAAFSVDADSPDVTVSLKNTYTKWNAVDFTIYKYGHYTGSTVEGDKVSTGLAGAQFQLYEDAACTQKVTGTNVVASGTTGIAGYLTLSGFTVPAGDVDGKVEYYLKETAAPTNYKPVDTVWKVTIFNTDGSYDISISLPEGVTATGWNWDHSKDVLGVKNDQILGQITVTKEFVDDLIPDGLNQIQVGLYESNGNRRENATLTAGTNGEWTHTFSNLPMGTYYIMEDGAEVPGYTLTTKYYEGDSNTPEGNENSPAAYATVVLSPGSGNTDPAPVSLKISNAYAKQTKLIVLPTSVTIEKRDSESKSTLAGAKFELLDTNKNKVGNADEYWETDASGRVTISELMLSDVQYSDYLANGNRNKTTTYYLREAVAPAGYQPSDKQWKITLSGETVQVDVVDPVTNIFTTIIQTILGMGKDSGTSDTLSEDAPGDDGVLTVYNAPSRASL